MTAESPDALRICVAVPYFSNLEYLDVALRSLVAQTDPHWTAIVVDDAAPEPGADAVVAALGDARIRYVRNEHNLGISANFNRCLELAGADADDRGRCSMPTTCWSPATSRRCAAPISTFRRRRASRRRSTVIDQPRRADSNDRRFGEAAAVAAPACRRRSPATGGWLG